METITLKKRYNLDINFRKENELQALKILEMSGFKVVKGKSYSSNLSLLTVENVTVCQCSQVKSLIKNIKVYD